MVALYARALSNNVVYRTARTLTGPWSDEGALFTANEGDAGGTVDDPYPHPELAKEGGRVQYFTYSRSDGTAFGSVFALVRVTFE